MNTVAQDIRFARRAAGRACALALLSLALLAAFFSWGACKEEKHDQTKARRQRISKLAEVASPLDTGVSSNSKQRFVNLIRYRLNLILGDDVKGSGWDLWAEGSSSYPLGGGRKGFLVSFRRVLGSEGQKGLMMIGRMEGEMASVLGQWRIDASIDDMHVVDLGLPVGVLIHTVSMATGKVFNTLYHHLLRYNEGVITETWSVRGGYKTSAPGAYRPPVIRFVDRDKDGKKEVYVRVPGSEKSKKRSRRWARFVWNDYQKTFLPKKNLAGRGVAYQRPIGERSGFLEALREGEEETGRGFLHGRRDGCQHPDDLVYAFDSRRWRRSGRLKKVDAPFKRGASKSDRAVISVPLKKKGEAGRYEARVELIREPRNLSHWTVCRCRFLKW